MVELEPEGGSFDTVAHACFYSKAALLVLSFIASFTCSLPVPLLTNCRPMWGGLAQVRHALSALGTETNRAAGQVEVRAGLLIVRLMLHEFREDWRLISSNNGCYLLCTKCQMLG